VNVKDAAAEVLRQEGGGPLAVADIADRVLQRGLVSLRGKTPKATISAQLYVDAKKPNGRFERAARGMIRLRDQRAPQ
jgi:hypothetical protein